MVAGDRPIPALTGLAIGYLLAAEIDAAPDGHDDPPDRASPSDITRSSHALGAPCPARLAGFLLRNDASELGA